MSSWDNFFSNAQEGVEAMKEAFLRMTGSRAGMITIVSLVAVVGYIAFTAAKGGKTTEPTSRSPRLSRVSSSVDGISNDRVMQQEVVSRVVSGYQPFRPSPQSLPEKEEHQMAVFVPKGKLVHSFQPEAPKSKPPQVQASEVVLPPGVLVPCRLFNGIESNLPDTPLIAHVLADIRVNGKVVVPTGSQVHGTVRVDDHRNRVMTGSSWQLVTPRGKVIKVSGVGLTRDYDSRRDVYGSSDGFAGIGGVEVRQDQQASKRFFAGTGLAAVSKLSQQRNPTLFGDQVVASLGNSVMEGGASVANEYARMKLKEIEKNKPFIRVAAGTEFYLYTQHQVAIAQPTPEAGLSEALREREKLMGELRTRLRAQTEASAQP